MQIIELLRQIVDYNRWADRLTFESLKNEPDANVQSLRPFVHLLIAEKEWLARLTQNKDSSGYDFWPEMSLAQCEVLMDKAHSAYDLLLSSLSEENLADIAVYKNSEGDEYQTAYQDILLHVMLHSAYHRGQVAMAQRASGKAPAYTDYIAFVREQNKSKHA